MKKQRTRRIWALVTAMVLLTTLPLSAYGNKSCNTVATTETIATTTYVMNAEKGQTNATFLGENLNTLKVGSGDGLSPSSDIGSPADTGRKLIRDMNMSVEARDFDGVFSQIINRVRELGGYVESSDVSGISVNSYDGSQQHYADTRIKIPADRLDRFVETVESTGNVTSKREQITDVTPQYSDVQSRKKSMEIEQKRLWTLSEKAESLDVMVTLEAQLSEIRYESESYTSQLRLYDNQMGYGTVPISMREVKDLTPTAPDSIGTRVQKGFNRSLNNLEEAGADLIVWIVSNSPILLVLAVITVAIVLFVGGLSRRMQGRLRFLSRSSSSRGKRTGKKKGRRDRKVQAAEEQTGKAVEERTENRKTLEEQTGRVQKEKE